MLAFKDVTTLCRPHTYSKEAATPAPRDKSSLWKSPQGQLANYKKKIRSFTLCSGSCHSLVRFVVSLSDSPGGLSSFRVCVLCILAHPGSSYNLGIQKALINAWRTRLPKSHQQFSLAQYHSPLLPIFFPCNTRWFIPFSFCFLNHNKNSSRWS